MILRAIRRYHQLSVSKKAALWYVICNILQKGIAFLVIPLYVRLLTTAEYGQYTIFQAWCNIIIIFATLNLYCGVFTKAMVDHADDRDRYTSSMQGLSTLITIVLFGVYMLFHEFWNRSLELDTPTVALMFLYFIAFPAFSFWTVRQRVENKYKSMVVVTLFLSVATPIISLLLLYLTSLRANAVIWGFLISQILFGLYFYFYHFVKGKCLYDKNYWFHGLKYNIPLIPHYLSLIVLGQIDRVLIGYYCGKDKAGIYGLAHQVSMLMNVILTGVNGSLVPWIYERFKEKKFSVVGEQSNQLTVLVGVMTIMAIVITPDIITIVGTKDYTEAIWIIPPVAISVFFSFCYGLFACIEFYYNATKYVMIATSTGACVSLILNMLLLPRFGYLSAGYVSLTCYALFLLMHYVFMRIICKNELNGIKVFDSPFIFRVCILMLILMSLCLILYKYPVIRYGVVVAFLVAAITNKDYIKSIITLQK